MLLSGDHEKVDRWRRERSIERTAERRPELLSEALAAGLLDSEEAAAARRHLDEDWGED